MPIDTITIGAGESAWLPKTAKILSVDATNDLVLQGSDCIDTTVAPRICMTFTWITDEDENEEHPWDNGTLLKSFNIGSNKYLFTGSVSAKVTPPLLVSSLDYLISTFPNQGIIEFTAYAEQVHELKREGHVLTVSVPSSFTDIYLEFEVPHTDSTTTSLFAKGVIIPCENPV